MSNIGNTDVWVALSMTPKEAQKTIKGGRLNGFTDINPMWRFKVLTETFGACGIGWKYEIVRLWLEQGAENDVKAMCHINLYIKTGDEWSAPIPGLGGSSFVSAERGGLYTSDECYKMALTDAIGTACKALGMSADIFYSQDRSKYTNTPEPEPEPPKTVTHPKCSVCGKDIVDVKYKSGAVKKAHEIVEFTTNTYGKQMCTVCMKEAMKGAGK